MFHQIMLNTKHKQATTKHKTLQNPFTKKNTSTTKREEKTNYNNKSGSQLCNLPDSIYGFINTIFSRRDLREIFAYASACEKLCGIFDCLPHII